MQGNTSKKLLVTSSPHVGSPLTTKRIMLHVIIALSFPLIAGVVLYGLYSLLVVALATGAAVFGEWLYNKIRRKPDTVSDLSAVVTGMILGLNMPPTVAFYVPVVGGIIATMFVKMLFGGLGKNFANPAATARVFLLLAWGTQMMNFVNPVDYGAFTAENFFMGFTADSAYVTSATPLAAIKSSALTGAPGTDLNSLFLGTIGGTIGETCKIAIILSAVYLIIFRIIDWKIPAGYFLSVALCSLVFYKEGWNYILPSLLSGGVMFAGVFMLTDYTTSPVTRAGVWIFAVGAGILTVLIRRYGGMNEGVSFAILLMNLLTPLIDKAAKPRPFGYTKPKKQKEGAHDGENK